MSFCQLHSGVLLVYCSTNLEGLCFYVFYSVGTKVPVCVCVCDWYKKCLGWFVCTKAPELGVIVCLLCMYGAWSVCGLFWCAHHLYSCRCVWWSCVQVRVVFGSSCGWLWTSQQNIVSLVVGYWTLHGLFVNWMCSQFLSLALSFPSSILLLHSLTLPPSLTPLTHTLSHPPSLPLFPTALFDTHKQT